MSPNPFLTQLAVSGLIKSQKHRCASPSILLSVLDHASVIFLPRMGRKISFRLGKKYALCAGTVLKQKDLR